MREKTVGKFRVTLIIVGLILLVVFGVRAAGQARDMSLAGAVQNRVQAVTGNVLGFLGFKDASPVAAPTVSAEPVSPQSEATNQSSAPSTGTKTLPENASDVAQDAVNKQKSNLNAETRSGQVNGIVNNTTNNVTKSIDKITDNAGDEFTRIWP